MGWTTRNWTAEMVVDVPSFANFVHQEIGTPYPTGAQMSQLKGKVREYFDKNPKATWATMTKITLWAKAKGRHPTHAWIVLNDARYAWRDGWLPELMPSERVDDWVEEGLEVALGEENDAAWRGLLLGSVGRSAREEALVKWRAQRSHA